VIGEDRAPTYGNFREHPESFPEWPPGTVAIEDQPDGGPPWPGG
jgi:hypothetical protein